jgi:hypothetical protein
MNEFLLLLHFVILDFSIFLNRNYMNFSNSVTVDCLNQSYTVYYLILTVIFDYVVSSQQYFYVILYEFYTPRFHVVPSVDYLTENNE